MSSVIVVVLLLVAQLQLAPDRKPSQGDAQQQQGAPDRRGTQDAPLLVTVQPSPKTTEEIAREQVDRANDAANKRATLWLTGLTVFVGFLQLGVIVFQARITKQQNVIIAAQNAIMQGQREAADTQTEHMEAGLTETRKAADAAVVSANALKVIHRQWVTVTGWEFELFPIANYGVDAKVYLRIANNTPLPLEILTVRCYFGPSKGALHVADKFLEPSGTFKHVVTHKMNDQQIADYHANRLQLVLSGWVHFYDAFGDLQSQIIGVWLDGIGPKGRPSAHGVSGLHRKMKRKEKDWPIQELLDLLEQHDREKDARGDW